MRGRALIASLAVLVLCGGRAAAMPVERQHRPRASVVLTDVVIPCLFNPISEEGICDTKVVRG